MSEQHNGKTWEEWSLLAGYSFPLFRENRAEDLATVAVLRKSWRNSDDPLQVRERLERMKR